MRRCGRDVPSFFRFKESAFVKGVAEIKPRCRESARSDQAANKNTES